MIRFITETISSERERAARWLGRWCQRLHLQEGPPSVAYRWEWNERTRYQEKHYLSNGGYDVLDVSAPGLHIFPRWKGRGKRRRVVGVRVGSWEYRKLASAHRLEMQYLPQGLKRDRRALADEKNATRRAAILAACGPQVLPEKTETVQQDDFGELLRLPTGEVMVRVVCPTTGKAYLLGARPGCRTAREAVAASFQMDEHDYAPVMQA